MLDQSHPKYDTSWFPDPGDWGQFCRIKNFSKVNEAKDFRKEMSYRSDHATEFLLSLGIRRELRAEQFVTAILDKINNTTICDKRGKKFLFEQAKSGKKVCFYVQRVTSSLKWGKYLHFARLDHYGHEIPSWNGRIPQWAKDGALKANPHRTLDNNFESRRLYWIDIDREQDLDSHLSLVEKLGLSEYLAAVVQTSENKYHLYLKCGESSENLYACLVDIFGADKNSLNPLAIAQLPGYHNPKSGFESKAVLLNKKAKSLEPQVLTNSLLKFLSEKENREYLNKISHLPEAQVLLAQLFSRKKTAGRPARFSNIKEALIFRKQQEEQKFREKAAKFKIRELKNAKAEAEANYAAFRSGKAMVPFDEDEVFKKKIFDIKGEIFDLEKAVKDGTIHRKSVPEFKPNDSKSAKAHAAGSKAPMPGWVKYREAHNLSHEIPIDIDIHGRRNQALLALCRYAQKYVDLENGGIEKWVGEMILPYFSERQSSDLNTDRRSGFKTIAAQARSLLEKSTRTASQKAGRKTGVAQQLAKPEKMIESFNFDTNVILSRIKEGILEVGGTEELADLLSPVSALISAQISQFHFQKFSPCLPAFYQTKDHFIYSNFFVHSESFRLVPGASDYNKYLKILASMGILFRTEKYIPAYLGEHIPQTACRNFLLLIPKSALRRKLEANPRDQEFVNLHVREMEQVGTRDSFAGSFWSAKGMSVEERRGSAREAISFNRFDPQKIKPVLLEDLNANMPTDEEWKRFKQKDRNLLGEGPVWKASEIEGGRIGPKAFLSTMENRKEWGAESYERKELRPAGRRAEGPSGGGGFSPPLVSISCKSSQPGDQFNYPPDKQEMPALHTGIPPPGPPDNSLI